jgi:DNA replication protein DnaC
MTATENCPLCDGTGWKILEREELSGAERCICVAAGRVERYVEGADIPPLYTEASFDNFVLPRDNPIAYPQMTEVFVTVKAWVREFPGLKTPGLLLIGRHGTGKTHLAVAALRAVMAKGFEGLFCDYQNLLDRIRSGYDSTAHAADKEAYRVAMEKEVLLLDDLGAHRVSDWVEDTVTSIITARCNNRKPLIATTNLIDSDAGYTTYDRSGAGEVDARTTLTERIGPRARSRLFEMCKVIRMPDVMDYRVRKRA